MTEAKLDELCNAFFCAFSCCLDESFSEELWMLLTCPADLQREKLLSLIKRVGRRGKVTNMQLENLLALIKASTPATKGQYPPAERHLALGHLTQLMAQHLESGNDDVRKMGLRDLIKLGVPLLATKKKRRAKRGTPRTHL